MCKEETNAMNSAVMLALNVVDESVVFQKLPAFRYGGFDRHVCLIG